MKLSSEKQISKNSGLVKHLWAILHYEGWHFYFESPLIGK